MYDLLKDTRGWRANKLIMYLCRYCDSKLASAEILLPFYLGWNCVSFLLGDHQPVHDNEIYNFYVQVNKMSLVSILSCSQNSLNLCE